MTAQRCDACKTPLPWGHVAFLMRDTEIHVCDHTCKAAYITMYADRAEWDASEAEIHAYYERVNSTDTERART